MRLDDQSERSNREVRQTTLSVRQAIGREEHSEAA